MVSIRSVAGSLFALALLTLPAKAVPIAANVSGDLTRLSDFFTYVLSGTAAGISGSVDSPVHQNETYEASIARNIAVNFTDVYTVTINPLLPIQVSASQIVITGRGFSSLQVEWIGPGAVDQTFNVLTSPGGIIDQSLSLGDGVGTYLLKVIGSTVGFPQGGSYRADIETGTSETNQTPIPGTVFLFGSVLAGGMGGMQLMRRRRAVRIA